MEAQAKKPGFKTALGFHAAQSAQPAFGNGSCIEDSQKVSALAYGIRRKEKATLFENYVRDMAAEVCKKAIDSLWIETEEFLKQLS